MIQILQFFFQIQHEKFATEQSSCGSTREKMLCKLAIAYDVFKDLRNNLQEGVKFYNDLTQVFSKFVYNVILRPQHFHMLQ